MQERAALKAAGPAASTLAYPQPNFAAQHARPGALNAHSRAASTPGRMWAAVDRQSSMDAVGVNERTQLLKRRHSMVDTTELEDGDDRMNSDSNGPVAGGTVLGIHNLAIVFPQFVVSEPIQTSGYTGQVSMLTTALLDDRLPVQVAIISSLIFKAVANAGRPGERIPAPGTDDFTSDTTGPESFTSGTAWVLRFGGLCALVAAAIPRRGTSSTRLTRIKTMAH